MKSKETWWSLFILMFLAFYFDSNMAGSFKVILAILFIMIVLKILSFGNDNETIKSSYIFFRRLIVLVIILALSTCANNTRDKEINTISYNLDNGIKLKFIIYARYVSAIPGSYIFEPQLVISKKINRIQVDSSQKQKINHYKMLESEINPFFIMGRFCNTDKYNSIISKNDKDIFNMKLRSNEWDIFIDPNKLSKSEFDIINNCITKNIKVINDSLSSEETKQYLTKKFPRDFRARTHGSVEYKITSVSYFDYNNTITELNDPSDKNYRLLVYRSGRICFGSQDEGVNENIGLNISRNHVGTISENGKYLRLHQPDRSPVFFGDKPPTNNEIMKKIARYTDHNGKTLFDYFEIYHTE